MLKQILALALLITAVVAEIAYFEFVRPGYNDRPFVIQFTDDENIQHARALARGETNEKPKVTGTLVKERAHYNPNYNYYVDPWTILFVEENDIYCYCDFTFNFIEKNFNDACTEVFLQQCTVCSSLAVLNREVSRNLVENYQASFRTGGGFLDQEYVK